MRSSQEHVGETEFFLQNSVSQNPFALSFDMSQLYDWNLILQHQDLGCVKQLLRVKSTFRRISSQARQLMKPKYRWESE